MKQIFLNRGDLQDLPGVELQNVPVAIEITKISTDTRTIEKGSLFVAIEGDNFDGHKFINEAFKKGAALAIVSKQKYASLKISKAAILIVDDTISALGQLAAMWRNKFTGSVICITGSNGKTGTKEFLYSILKEKYPAVATAKNYNNFIGVPMTVFRVSNEDRFLILELGTNHSGEIAYLSEIVKPDLALVTNIGNAHIEYFGSRKEILKEKKAVFDAAAERGGKVFINADDKYLKPLEKIYQDVVTFGSKSSRDASGKLRRVDKHGFPVLNIEGFNKSFEVTLPVYGKTSGLNALAAAAIALSLGISKQDIVHGLKNVQALQQRLEAKKFSKGLIIDDTYNASPESMLAAFDVVKNIKSYKNKWVILGDMFELGDAAPKMHQSLAASIMKIPNIRVLTIGENMRHLFKELKRYYVPVWHSTSRAMLLETIQETDFSDSVILIKGSRGTRMEEFVAALQGKYK